MQVCNFFFFFTYPWQWGKSHMAHFKCPETCYYYILLEVELTQRVTLPCILYLNWRSSITVSDKMFLSLRDRNIGTNYSSLRICILCNINTPTYMYTHEKGFPSRLAGELMQSSRTCTTLSPPSFLDSQYGKRCRSGKTARLTHFAN